MKPILIFPKSKIFDRDPLSGGGSKLFTPSPAKQRLRLNTSFNQLKSSFTRAALSVDPAGFSPERTLVLETSGSVGKFYRAARKLEGLEFIQELVGDEIPPDDDFYYQKKGEVKSDKALKGFIYLTMTNEDSLNKLIKYWDNYSEDENYQFPTGLAPLKNLFACLYNIRYWDTSDRLKNTGLIGNWIQRIEDQQEDLPVEIDFWFRDNSELRHQSEERVKKLIDSIGGQVVQSYTLEPIQYHAILAKIPAQLVTSLLHGNLEDIELMRCDDVMYFRPSGQCMAPVFISDNADEEDAQNELTIDDNDEPPDSHPVVALFDGLPLENHQWIKDFIMIDDPDDWASAYHNPSEQQHGTSMASLIIRGDMEESDGVLNRKIYCRPILTPFATGFDSTAEKIPDDVLPIDIVHRAVVRLFEPEGDQDSIAPSIKVINLSIADPERRFDGQMSPWAKLIDYLSYKYQTNFVISAGNHTHDIVLNMTNEEFIKLDAEHREATILSSIADEEHLRRLMSPAESINAITVASSHEDELVEEEFYSQINPYTNRKMPSPINPVTWGSRRSVKPDVLMPGGRATYRLKGVLDSDQAILRLLAYNRPPGQMVASPGTSGNLNSYAHTFGTSNAAALASRRLGFLYDTLHDLYTSNHGDNLSREYEAVLLKALFCHGATQASSFNRIEELFKTKENSQVFKSIAPKYLGYGNIEQERVHGCLDNQATILQCGKIKHCEAHTYRFRLPDSLRSQVVNRRLIITLAWFTPINPSSSTSYRRAHLYFKPPAISDQENNHLAVDSREVDWNMVKAGTVQHEVFTGENKAAVYSSETSMEIKVSCRSEDDKELPIAYGLVVTLDTPGVDLPIYEEVKADLEIQYGVEPSVPQQTELNSDTH